MALFFLFAPPSAARPHRSRPYFIIAPHHISLSPFLLKAFLFLSSSCPCTPSIMLDPALKVCPDFTVNAYRMVRKALTTLLPSQLVFPPLHPVPPVKRRAPQGLTFPLPPTINFINLFSRACTPHETPPPQTPPQTLKQQPVSQVSLPNLPRAPPPLCT